MFDQDRGVEVDFNEEETIKEKSFLRKARNNFNRGNFEGTKIEDTNSKELSSNILQKVNLEIVKESLPTRKMIYQLQLEQKRIRDEIAW